MFEGHLEPKLKIIEDLIDNKHFKNAIEDTLAIIEKLLRHLYKESIIHLTVKEKDNLYNIEKKYKKTLHKLMLGELIGIFKQSGLIKVYERVNNKKFAYLTLTNISHLNKVRVKCTHNEYESSFSEANLFYYTLRNILNEINIFPAIELDQEKELTQENDYIEKKTDFSLQNLPRPEYHKFIGRKKYIKEILDKLGGRSYIISIDGIGGVGKSALALEVGKLCWEKQIFSSVIWVSAKKQRLRINGIQDISPDISNYNDLLDTILEVYGFEDAKEYILEKKEKKVIDFLKNAKTLLIIDNLETVEDPEIINFLMDIPVPSKVLITSRKRIGEVERVIVLKEFSLEESKLFLKVECEEKKVMLNTILETNIEKIHKSTGGIPLALKLIVGWLASGVNLKDIIEKLSKKDSELLEFCFNESHNNLLDDNSKKIFCLFPIFPGELVSKNEIEAASNLHGDNLNGSLNQLYRLSLINLEKKFDEFESSEIYYYSMLPLTLNFAYIKLTDCKGLEIESRKRLANYYELHLKPKDALLFYRSSFLKEMDLRTQKGKTAVIIANLAFSSYQRGDLRKARTLFKQAVNTDPRLSYSYQLWATIERQQGNYSYAEQLFKKASKLNPKNPIIWSSWAMMKKDVKDLNGAAELLKTGISNSPKVDPILFQQLAVVESMLDNYEESVKLSTENLIINPKRNKDKWVNTTLATSFLETYWKWALKLFKDKKYREGYEKLELALKKRDEYKNIIFHNNSLYRKKICKIYHTFGIKKSQGRMYDEAEELLNKAYHPHPKDEYERYHNCLVDYHKALNYYYWNKKNKTIEYYEKIKNQVRNFPKLKRYVFDLEHKLNKLK